MKEEDVIVAYSKKTVFAIGYIDGPYYYDETNLLYPHRRAVRWETFEEALTLKKDIWRPLATNNVVNKIANPVAIRFVETVLEGGVSK